MHPWKSQIELAKLFLFVSEKKYKKKVVDEQGPTTSAAWEVFQKLATNMHNQAL